MEQNNWEKEFDEKFVMVGDNLKHLYYRSWHLPAEPDDVKQFISTLLSSHNQKLLEQIEGLEFKMNVDEYLKLVEEWDGKNFDVAFDNGYKKAKEDVKNLLTKEK